jgi:hypothetical protein
MRFALLLSAITLLHAQGTSPKSKATDYPVHVQLDSVTLAAEYLIHSLPTPQGNLIASDYLIVEVAFYGPSFSRLKMSPDNFTLRINGKATLTTEAPGMVSGSIKNPSSRPHLEGGGSIGMGDGTISVGPRPPPSQFPGDGNDRTPAGQPTTTVKSVEEDTNIDHRVQNVSLPEGEHSLPRSGLLYFYYRGKIKSIRSLELLYAGAMGKASLKLLP